MPDVDRDEKFVKSVIGESKNLTFVNRFHVLPSFHLSAPSTSNKEWKYVSVALGSVISGQVGTEVKGRKKQEDFLLDTVHGVFTLSRDHAIELSVSLNHGLNVSQTEVDAAKKRLKI